LTLTVPRGRAVSHELCPLLTYKTGYWNVYRYISGGAGSFLVMEVTWNDLYMKEFFLRNRIFDRGRAIFPSII